MALCDFFQWNSLILILLLWHDGLKIQCKHLFNNSQNTSLKHWSVRMTDLQMNKLNTSERTDLNSHIEGQSKNKAMDLWKKVGVLPEIHCHGTVLAPFKSCGDNDSWDTYSFFFLYITLVWPKKKSFGYFLLTLKLTSHQLSLVRGTNVDVFQIWSSVQVMAAEVFQLCLQLLRNGNNIFVSKFLCHLLPCFLLPSQIFLEDVNAVLPQTTLQCQIC